MTRKANATAGHDLADFGAVELLRLYRDKEVSPVEATHAVLERIERLEHLLNTYVVLDRDGALASAERSERRWAAGEPIGILDGVPLSIKDLVLTRGLPTRRGTLAMLPDPGTEDAPIARNVRDAGAVILGKTTVSEFAWKAVGDCPATGITRNPWDPTLTPGASSAGAAAGLAAGMATLATGSDGGGSIRIPASFTGIFGLKPTFALVPLYPPSPVGMLSHGGPLARSVRDGALLLQAMSRPDTRDCYAPQPYRDDYSRGLDEGEVAGLTIAYSPTLGYADVDPQVAMLVRGAAALLNELGAEVEEVETMFEEPFSAYRVLVSTGLAQIARGWPDDRLALLDPGLQDAIQFGRTVSADDYLGAIGARERLAIAMASFHERYDLLLTPTLPITAFSVGRDAPGEVDPVRSWLDWNPFTYPFNMTQQPAASVPCGLAHGLPVGCQLVGRRFEEAVVLRASRAIEAHRPIPRPNLARLEVWTATTDLHASENMGDSNGE